MKKRWEIKRHLSGVKAWLTSGGGLRNILIFLVFTAIAAAFWVIMALNEDIQKDFEVRVAIEGVPDSVTFINDPPSSIRVNIRAKGTAITRHLFLRKPVMRINFREYSSNGLLRVPQKNIDSYIHAIFGKSAVITATSLDSIHSAFTTSPGKMVPVRIDYDITTGMGKILASQPQATPREVVVYSYPNVLDTISYVRTDKIIKRDLTDPTVIQVSIMPVRGAKVVPDKIEVRIPVEPLEARKNYVQIVPVHVPPNESLILFPDKVEVSYLVPMSKNEDIGSSISVVADYAEIRSSSDEKMPIRLKSIPSDAQNASLAVDSVEFTVVRQSQ